MSLMSWKILSSAAGLLTLGALLEVRSQTLNGVPDVTAEQITSLEQCLGVDAVGRVQRSLDRWQQPCDDVWESPVWSRRRLEVQGSGREWEEVLWQLVFREDLTSGGGAVSPVPCVPTEGSATSIQATLLDDEVLAKQAIEQSTPQEVFVTGCKLRGARFLTETDEIDMVTLNRTLNSFAIADSLKQLLLQNRRTCLDYSSSIVVEELTFPLRNELGRQLAFFQCVLQQLLTSCDTFQQLEEALGGTDLGDLLNSGSIEDVINEILSG